MTTFPEKNNRFSQRIKTFSRSAIFKLALFLCAMGASNALAATYTWDGGGVDNNWSTCANWSTNTCPVAADSVIFDGTSTKDSTIDTNITISAITINVGYSGTITTGASTPTFNGAFTQNAGTFVASSGTITFKSTFTFSAGTFTHNSGTVSFSNPAATSLSITPGGVIFNNVFFDYPNSSGTGVTTQLLGDMTVLGNMTAQNTNGSGGSLTIQSNVSGTPRTITVGGNLDFPTTAGSGSINLGTSTGTFNIVVDFAGNLSATDTNAVLYGDLIFSGAGTQTISKASSAQISSFSDWYDTGAGNLALSANFSGSQVLHTEDATDFNFTSNAFTFTSSSAVITAATSFTPVGPASYVITTLSLSTGTFNASSIVSIGTLTINGGTFNATSSGNTTITTAFTYTSGTFNHNSGTIFFSNAASTNLTVTPGGVVFNNVFFDYTGSGGSVQVRIAGDMTVNGNMSLQNTNSNGGRNTVQSDISGTPRTIYVAGNLDFPTNGSSYAPEIGLSTGLSNIVIDLKGNLSITDSSPTIYGDIVFSGTGTQAISKHSSATVSSVSDWYDTGSGNLSLAANFSGSQTLHTDNTDDFNFTSNAFTFTSGSVIVSPGTSFSPLGPASYVITTLNHTTGTFNCQSTTSIVTLTIDGGVFNGTSGDNCTVTGAFTYTSGTFNHNSGTMFFSNAAGTNLTVTPGGAVFNNVYFNSSLNSGTSVQARIAGDMIVNGNMSVKNTNGGGGRLTVQSDISGTPRTIYVAGNLDFPTGGGSFKAEIGLSTGLSNIVIDLKGNLSMTSTNADLYGDIVFSGTGTQAISKNSSTTIYSVSDWYDTGSGNLSLAANFSGSQVLHTDDATDFNFTSNAFTFTCSSSPVITAGTSFTPAGPASYVFPTLTVSTGTFNSSSIVSIAALTINGGTFNATASGVTTITSAFTYTSGTFNHNSGTVSFLNPASTTISITPGSAVFNNILFDAPNGSGANTITQLLGDMTVAGNMTLQNTNTAGGGLTVQSNLSGTARTITVAGNLDFPTTAGTATIYLGNSSGTNNTIVDLKGNLSITDTSATLFGDVIFSSASTQTISKNASATVNSVSDWYDTGAGDLALSANFSGSQVLHTEDATDFNFTSNAFTFTSSNVVITAATSFTPAGPASYVFTTLTVPTGTFNASSIVSIGTITINGGTFNAASSANINITSGFTYTSGTFNHNSGTISFINPASTTISITAGSAVFNNILFDGPSASGANVVTQLLSDMTVAGNMTLQNNNVSGGGLTVQSNLSGTARTITVGGNLDFPTTAGTATIYLGNSSGTNNIIVDLAGNLSVTDTSATLYGDVIFSSASTQTISKGTSATINSFSDWYDTGAGNLALSANFSGSQVLHTEDATDFNFTSNAFTFTSSNVVITAATSFTPAGPASYVFTTLTVPTGTFNASSIVSLGTVTINGGTFNATSSGNTTITSAFTYSSGTFNHNSGTVNFTNSSAGTLTITPGSAVFNNVLFDYTGSTGSNLTSSLAGDMTVSGNMTVQNNNTNGGGLIVQSSITGTSRTITVNGNLDFPTTAATTTPQVGNSGGTFNIIVDLKGNLSMTDSNASLYGDVGFSGSSTQTISKHTSANIGTVSDWTINKASGQAVLGSTLSSGGTLAITTGTFRTAGFNLTETSGLSVGASGNLQIQGGETITTPTFAVGATMTYDGTSGPYTLKNYSYKNLTISGSGATFNLPAALTVAGNLAITAGTLDATASNYGLNVAGNWSNTGTFTPRSGTVTLNGTNQNVTGSTTFYNLTKSVVAPDTLTFGAGDTQTVSNVWTANGTLGNLLSLRSSATPTRWNINPQGTRTLSYIDVKDSNNTNGTVIASVTGIVDSGHNLNWGFDDVAPTVNSLSPLDNATGVSPTVNLVINFSEVVNVGTGNITIKKTSDDSTVETIAVGSGQVTGGGTAVITIDPSVTLGSSTEYYVLIDSTAFVDGAANNYAGIASTTTWSFTTADTTNPSVSTLSPLDNATGVSGTANLIITFDEAVARQTGNITIKKTSDNSTVETIDVTSGQVTGTGTTTITVNPTTTLAEGVEYYVLIDASAFDDLAGNSYAGIASTTAWSFTILNVNPTVSTLSPVDNATGISPTANLVITFSEAVTVQTGNITIKKTSDNSTAETIDVTSGLVTGTGTTTITVNPSVTLAGSTEYYVLIDASAFDDLAGNSYAGIASTTAWSFTTSDTTPPVISEVTPVTTPTNDATPNYTFTTNEAGTITYGGSCSSATTSASSGSNTITLNTLTSGTYSNCTITVTDTSSNVSNLLTLTTFTVDTVAPTISQITPVTTPTNDTTPNYTFTTNEAGTITYGGSCSSATTSATSGSNTITFNTLSAGMYSNCTVTVTDTAGNASNVLGVTTFVIDITAPTISEVAPVGSPTNDTTPNYMFTTSEAGSISYGGSCSSATTSATSGLNTITLNTLTAGTYSDCTITVTDGASNVSNTLTINTFTIDTTAPTVAEVTPVTTPTNDTTPNYTFTTNEAGTITYGGSCSSATTSATSGSNTITFNTLSGGTYSNCTIRVTDAAGNLSTALSVNTFIIDLTAPTVAEVTPVTTPTNDTTPNYTFSTDEAGTISYGGSCSSGTTSATVGSNTVTFSALAGGTYSDCTITVTDNLGNVSTALNVSQFIIDTTSPTVSTLSPADDETDVSQSTNLVITFSESVNVGTGNIIIKKTSDDSTFEAIDVGSGQVTGGGTSTITIDPSASLGNNIEYYVLIDASAFDDLAGNSYAGIASTTAWSFITIFIDSQSPTISEVTPVTTPTNNTTPNYTFTTDEAGTITYGGSCSSATTSATVGSNTITLSTLSGGTYSNCTITVTDTALNVSNTLNVSSFVIDLTGPTVSALSPADNTISVSTGANLVITFDESVNVGTGNITIKKTNDDSTIEAIDITSGQVTGNGTAVLTVNPTAPLADLTEYYVLIDATAVHDIAGNNFAGIESTTDWSFTTGDATTPVISEVTPVTNPTNDTTPDYTFTASEDGAITYGGSCSSATTSATAGSNTITFNALADGTYSNCTIQTTDDALNVSNTLNVSLFVIDTVAPGVSQVTPVTTPTNDTTPNYTFTTNEAGLISYGGSCSSATVIASSGSNTITLNTLTAGTYGDCTVTVTDGAGNSSVPLMINTFTIDTTAPVISEVTPVPSPTTDATPNYTFTTDEVGTITYGGSCSSATTSATSGSNTITFNTLSNATYSNCTIRVTDAAGNLSTVLSVNTFTVDTTLPTVSTLSPLDNAINVSSTANLTIDFSEAITIGTGNITIKKTSDDTTVETIAVGSGQVTGSGTSTITIDPSTSLDNNEGYYVLIDATAFDDLAGNSYAGIVSTTAWSFTIGAAADTTAPTIAEVTPVTTPADDTTPDYTFTTDEAGMISYGGSCTSATTSASIGSNTITFNALTAGTYSDCTITVTDGSNNASSLLTVSPFTITAPTTEIVPSRNGSVISPETGVGEVISLGGIPQVLTAARLNFVYPGEDPEIISKLGMSSTEYQNQCATNQGKPYYRNCSTTFGLNDFDFLRENVVCEGLIKEQSNPLDYRPTDIVTRKEVVTVAVRMRKEKGEAVSMLAPADYKNTFNDISLPGQEGWLAPMVETALHYGIVTPRTLFEGSRNVKRIEAFAMLTRSICVVATDKPDETWGEKIYRLSYESGLTSRDWKSFEPDRSITRQELFKIAAKTADLAERTGGCNPKPDKCFLGE